MVWNNRVVRQVYEGGEVTFSIHEAYYPEVGATPDSITSDSVSPQGETLEELRNELLRMLKACDYPVLEYTDF